MKKRSGPRTHYAQKDPRPVSLCLTTLGRVLLDQHAERAGASRSDVVEFLVRHYGDKVQFPEET